jgi:DNA (cytosine-5)-methyltransferase 1
MAYKIASFFAGIGGIDKGFENVGFKSVWANDIDHSCSINYTLNFPQVNFVLNDINNVKGIDIPHVDVLAGGFPCQPFSIAGHRKGFDDDRGGLFFEISRIISELDSLNKKPRVIFLENVKNLLTHKSGATYQEIKSELSSLGYVVKEKILNTNEYGNLPQNRERLFIVAFANEKDSSFFDWPKPKKLTLRLEDIIGFDEDVEKKYYYTQDSVIYEMLKTNVINEKTVYQYRRVYVRENKSGVSPTLTANMGMGGHNVPIILDSKKRIRKLTPRECLLLQGFNKEFKINEKMADSTIYKQAGNSVSITVIEALAKSILSALRSSDECN